MPPADPRLAALTAEARALARRPRPAAEAAASSVRAAANRVWERGGLAAVGAYRGARTRAVPSVLTFGSRTSQAGQRMFVETDSTLRHAKRAAELAYRRYRARTRAIPQGQEEVIRRRSAGDRRGEAVKLNALGKAYRERGQHAEAVVCYMQALAIFRDLKSRRGEGLSLSNLGLVYDSQGNRTKAIRCYEDALEIFRALGDRQIEGQVLANLGTTYRRQGQRQLAAEVWRDALELVSPGTRAHQQLAQHLEPVA